MHQLTYVNVMISILGQTAQVRVCDKWILWFVFVTVYSTQNH